MRLAPERGSSQNEQPGTFKVARCVSFFPFSTRVSTETVRCAGADDEFTIGQVVLPKSDHHTVDDPADVPLLPYSTNAIGHADSSDVSRRRVVPLLNCLDIPRQLPNVTLPTPTNSLCELFSVKTE